MTAFSEVRFPPDISYGATGGPAFSTTVFPATSGFEQRNVNWAEVLGRWDVGAGLKNKQQAATLTASGTRSWGCNSPAPLDATSTLAAARAGGRVMVYVGRFPTTKLRLTINESKSAVAPAGGANVLGLRHLERWERVAGCT